LEVVEMQIIRTLEALADLYHDGRITCDDGVTDYSRLGAICSAVTQQDHMREIHNALTEYMTERIYVDLMGGVSNPQTRKVDSGRLTPDVAHECARSQILKALSVYEGPEGITRWESAMPKTYYPELQTPVPQPEHQNTY
jgi:hypothetical protein